MLIDCARCEVRDIQCGDCVVTVLLGEGRDGIQIEEGELKALDALAGVGMVPPLRLTLPNVIAS